MSEYFDNLETRSDSERSNDIGEQLPVQIKNAKENSSAFSEILKNINPEDIKSIEDLAKLPVLRTVSYTHLTLPTILRV